MPKWTHDFTGGVTIRGLKRASFQDMTVEHNRDIDELEEKLKDEQNNSDYLGNQYAKALRQLDTMKAERDSWMKRCERLVEAMRVHGYAAETLARIAEGVD